MDYQKDSDSASFSWKIKSSEITGINNRITAFTEKTTIYWKANMCL